MGHFYLVGGINTELGYDGYDVEIKDMDYETALHKMNKWYTRIDNNPQNMKEFNRDIIYVLDRYNMTYLDDDIVTSHFLGGDVCA